MACGDGALDGDETDKDCGGSCGVCPDGSLCTKASDCASGKCPFGRCVAPTCNDELTNGGESDVDCGGPCPTKCADGKACAGNQDCAASSCVGGTCRSCTDALRNGDETDVDCGGSCAAGCADLLHCAVDTDCSSGSCAEGACRSCTDGRQNGNEQGIDCGGGCPGCVDGTVCVLPSDCASGRCDATVCASCSDRVRSGNEVDVDCGGPCPQLCADGSRCNVDADCRGGGCEAHVCVSCNDHRQNRDETDVDCGGHCGPCANFRQCLQNQDCASGHCANGVCASCSDGQKDGDETDVDCGGSCPSACRIQQACLTARDCSTRRCEGSRCVGWNLTTLDTHAFGPGSMLIDPSDRIHFVWPAASEIKDASFSNAQWTVSTIVPNVSPRSAALVRMSDGKLWLAYLDHGAIKVVTQGTSGWGPMTTLTGGATLYEQAVIVDSGASGPWVIGEAVNSVWAFSLGSGWQAKQVSSTSLRDPISAIGTASGAPLAAYSADSAAGPVFLDVADAAAAVNTGAHVELNSFVPSLVMSPAGALSMAFVHDGTLKYGVRSSAGVWSTEVVETRTLPFKDVSAALDAQGNPRIAYVVAGQVLYAIRDASGWMTTQVGLGTHVTLQVTSTGAPVVAVVNDSNGQALVYQ